MQRSRSKPHVTAASPRRYARAHRHDHLDPQLVTGLRQRYDHAVRWEITNGERADVGRSDVNRAVHVTGQRSHCRISPEADIGEHMTFVTKPELARRILERARDAGAPFEWFTADEAYGDNPGLRAWLIDQDINYGMAISCDQRFSTRPAGYEPTSSLRWPRSREGSVCRPERARPLGSVTPRTEATAPP